jgi:hypothetical protein
VHTRYTETVGEWKGIESDFYSNGSPNEDLESEFKKDSWRCSNAFSLIASCLVRFVPPCATDFRLPLFCSLLST